jgi:hypothetical protein
MIDLDEDLEEIFDTANFATSAVFTIVDNTPPTPDVTLTVLGEFREGSDASVIFGAEIEGVQPSITCITSEVAAVKQKMSVLINNRTFTVERIQKVGTGVTVLYLKT